MKMKIRNLYKHWSKDSFGLLLFSWNYQVFENSSFKKAINGDYNKRLDIVILNICLIIRWN